MSKLKTENDVKELIEQYDYENVVIFSNPDYASAFVGISENNRAIYDYDEMIEFLVKENGMTGMEAIEFIEYNTIRSLPYFENAPIILYKLY
jgi:hypothetical protein